MIYPHLAELPVLLASKIITKRKHPDHPLYVYNYSPAAQSLPISKWSEALKDCRGLILDENGEIVGRGFSKFWNLEQVQDQANKEGERFEVLEKMDGSLIIVCNYKGHRIVATRGSFESEQALWANNWLRTVHDAQVLADPDWVPFMPKKNESWLFEAVYPSNRIVVNYDFDGLVWLDTLNEWGTSIQYVCTSWFEERTGSDCHYTFRKAKVYTNEEMDELIANQPDNHEGFVLRWPSGFRAKVKFEEYKRLHRLLTSCSTTTIWEMLRAQQSKLESPLAELLDRVPEEFAKWATDVVGDLWQRHEETEDNAFKAFDEILAKMGIQGHVDDNVVDRKVFASYATKYPAPIQSLLFANLDGKTDQFDEIIWKFLKPKWSKPFKEAD